MNFLSIQYFLDLFSSNSLSFKQFLNTMKVRVNRELYSLEDYRKKMNSKFVLEYLTNIKLNCEIDDCKA